MTINKDRYSLFPKAAFAFQQFQVFDSMPVIRLYCDAPQVGTCTKWLVKTAPD